VDLGNRSGGERLGIDAGEDVFPGNAKLSLHRGHDLGLGERRDSLLESRQLVDDGRR